MRLPTIYALTCMLATLLLLPACDMFSKIKEEALEGVENLKEEAVGVKESVEATINKVTTAKDSVVEATDAATQAVTDLKAIGE